MVDQVNEEPDDGVHEVGEGADDESRGQLEEPADLAGELTEELIDRVPYLVDAFPQPVDQLGADVDEEPAGTGQEPQDLAG